MFDNFISIFVKKIRLSFRWRAKFNFMQCRDNARPV